MSTALNFDATKVAPSAAPETLPDGWYRAHATESAVKPTSAGTGKYLEIGFTVLDGPCAGRRFWDRLNIENPSAQTVTIAQAQLSAFCHAANVMQLANSQQLHHIPVMVKVIVKDGSIKKNPDGSPKLDAEGKAEKFPPKNEVKGYKACEGAGTRPQVGAAPAAASAPAWTRKSA